MNFAFVTRAVGAAQLALKANAPTLMVGAGVVSMGAAVVTASKKSMHLDEVLAPTVDLLDRIEQSWDQPTLSGGVYTPEMAQQDRYKVYARTGYALTKHYALPSVLFFGGAALVFGGHRIQLKRNAALAVAFTTVQNAFAKYRENVREAMGPDFDRGMLKGYKTKEVIDEKTGKKELVSVMDFDGTDIDPYNRVFEQGESDHWRPDLGFNKDFLEVQRGFAQQRLNHQRFLYLSDVYTALGFQETPMSRLVGWKVTTLPDGSRSVPHVSFGLDTPLADDWKYSQEHAVYLDFNCQGLIIGGNVQKIMERE